MIPAPEHLSWSQASEYSRCSKAYQLRRLYGAPVLPATWLFGGSLVHAAIELYNIAHVSGDGIDLDSIWATAVELTSAEQAERNPVPFAEWRKPYRGGMDIDEWIRSGQVHLEAWHAFMLESDWSIASFEGRPLVEIDLTCEYGWGDEKFVVKGAADVVMEQPGGDLVLLDIKTGAKMPNNFLQLGLYSCSMERLGMPKPSLGGYFSTKSGALASIDSMLQYTPMYFDDLLTRTREGITGGIFTPSLVADICRSCDVASACFAVRGHAANMYDPDHPDFLG